MFGRIRRVALACKPGKDRCHIGGDPGVDSEEIGNVRPAQAFGVPSRQEEIGDPARLVGVALSQRQESPQSCPGQLVHVHSSDGFDQTISTSVRLHGLLALDLRTSQERQQPMQRVRDRRGDPPRGAPTDAGTSVRLAPGRWDRAHASPDDPAMFGCTDCSGTSSSESCGLLSASSRRSPASLTFLRKMLPRRNPLGPS